MCYIRNIRPEKKSEPAAITIIELLFLRVILLRQFSVLILLAICISASAQDDEGPAQRKKRSRVIDDSTKQVYGPNTSKFYYEHDVFYNRPVIHTIDTLIKNFHRYNYVQGNNNFYQDLGNIGTAIRPVFYQAPDVIGARSGVDAYDLYWDSERIRYYDTKSPYSNMNVVLGGKGRSMTRATFSRNINPRWSFGITYRGFFIDKQVPERTGKGDRVTRSNYYDFFTSYYTKDSVYRIIANFRRMFHRIEEFGGVRQNASDSSFQGYFAPNLKVWLGDAESNDLRLNIHFNHQIKIGEALQVYHVLDRYRQKAKFLDIYAADGEFFPFQNIESDSAHDVSKFKSVRNEAGIKGNLLKLFYNGYVAIRHYTNTYNHWFDNSDVAYTKGSENYLGGRMELNIDSVGLLSGWAEIKQDARDAEGVGNYRIEGRLVSKWFEASVKQMRYQPSFMQQSYIGAFHEWQQQSFDAVESSQLNGYIHYRSKVLNVSPGLTFTRLSNYVFFEAGSASDTMRASPVQSSGNQVIFSPELRFSLTFFRHIVVSNQTVYTSLIENADDAIRVPEIFANTQVSYANIHFNGNLDMHAGVDIHWRSPYYAPAYDPAIRQFYNQDTFKLNAFPVVDLFLNAKIKRGRIFLKWNNLVQIVTKTGYFATPYYPGQRNIIDFGFDWSFYD
jgi:hypothetical protein